MKDYSIYVRLWDQENWVLSPKYEFTVNKSTTMKDLAHEIHKYCIEQNEANIILPEEMDICRILSIHKFSIIDLVDMEVFLLLFSTLVWSVRSVFLGNLCMSTQMDCSILSNKLGSSREVLQKRKKPFSGGKSRMQSGQPEEELLEQIKLTRRRKKESPSR